MSEAKHTPGPWNYGHSDPEASYPFFYVSCGEEYENELPDISIAVINYGGNNYDPATLVSDRAMAEANARLISAAPDLLDVCRQMLAYIESVSGIEQHEIPSVGPSGMCLAARAAITRATH